MFDRTNRLESQLSRKRYMAGQQLEDAIANCLKGHGLDLKKVSREVDMFDKIDRILVENGQEKSVAIKARMSYSGDDILIDVFEPYYGPKSDKTKHGRDYVGQYDIYVCLSRDGKQVRVIDGIRQKAIVEEVLKEWEGYNWILPVFDSHRYEGVQMRYTRDRAHGTPKVLMFIPTSVYTEQEIRLFEMKWTN